MKKVLSLLIVFSTILLLTNCGEGNTPVGIEQSIYRQMKNGNYEKAATIIINNTANYNQDAPEKAQIITVLARKYQRSTEANGEIKSFQVIDKYTSEDGLSATVEVKIVYGNGSEDTKLSFYIKEEDKWKRK